MHVELRDDRGKILPNFLTHALDSVTSADECGAYVLAVVALGGSMQQQTHLLLLSPDSTAIGIPESQSQMPAGEYRGMLSI